MKKKTNPLDDLTLPSPDTAAERRRKARQLSRIRRLKRGFFKVWVWTFTIIGPIAVLIALRGGSAGSEVTPTPSDTGRAVALAGLLDWAKTADPAVTVTGWTGWEPSKQLPNVEVHRFSILVGTGKEARGMIATEQVTVDGFGAQLLDKSPSVRIVGEPVAVPGLIASGETSVQSGPVTDAATRWANALVGSNPEALRVVTGDPVATRTYRSLDVAKSATDVVVTRTFSQANGLVARVTFTAGTFGKLSFDVLIAGADGAAPHVVSWGAVGTGTALTPFSAGFNAPVTTAGGK